MLEYILIFSSFHLNFKLFQKHNTLRLLLHIIIIDDQMKTKNNRKRSKTTNELLHSHQLKLSANDRKNVIIHTCKTKFNSKENENFNESSILTFSSFAQFYCEFVIISSFRSRLFFFSVSISALLFFMNIACLTRVAIDQFK